MAPPYPQGVDGRAAERQVSDQLAGGVRNGIFEARHDEADRVIGLCRRRSHEEIVVAGCRLEVADEPSPQTSIGRIGAVEGEPVEAGVILTRVLPRPGQSRPVGRLDLTDDHAVHDASVVYVDRMAGDDGRPAWLEWATRLQTIAQAGLEFAEDPYDVDRYRQVRTLALEIISRHVADATPVTLGELFPIEHGYLTPKVDVRAIVLDGDRVLLVKNASTDRWSLPGGFADLGESPNECVAREVQEETGYRVSADRLVALLEADRHRDRALSWSFWQVFIACTVIGGAPATSIETVDVGWFALSALPECDQRSPRDLVTEMACAASDPDALPICD